MGKILDSQTLELDEVERTLIPLASDDVSVGSCVVSSQRARGAPIIRASQE